MLQYKAMLIESYANLTDMASHCNCTEFLVRIEGFDVRGNWRAGEGSHHTIHEVEYNFPPSHALRLSPEFVEVSNAWDNPTDEVFWIKKEYVPTAVPHIWDEDDFDETMRHILDLKRQLDADPWGKRIICRCSDPDCAFCKTA